MTIATILRGKRAAVVSIEQSARVGEAVALLDRHCIGAVLVMDGAQPVGMLSERDVVAGLARLGAALVEQPVGAFMSAPVITIAPGESVEQAMALMTERRFRHLPVMEAGALVGIVSIGDLVKCRIDEACAEAAALKDYITAG